MRRINNERKSLSWSILGLLALFMSGKFVSVKGYPMMLEIPENDERCIRLNIPEEDDAHMVFLALPSLDNIGEVEKHFFAQMDDLTKRRTKSQGLLRRFQGKPSQGVQDSMNSFLSDLDSQQSGCKVTMTNPKSSSGRSMDTHWFTPLVINHVRKIVRTHKKDHEKSPLEGFQTCFANANSDLVYMIVDSVMVSDGPAYDDDDGASEDPAFQSHHLTPLAEQLGESIMAAKTVISEMQFMERREARMRHTADSVNSRVRYFSYISILILLVVTYLQVTYLKRYFRKKKLL